MGVCSGAQVFVYLLGRRMNYDKPPDFPGKAQNHLLLAELHLDEAIDGIDSIPEWRPTHAVLVGLRSILNVVIQATRPKGKGAHWHE